MKPLLQILRAALLLNRLPPRCFFFSLFWTLVQGLHFVVEPSSGVAMLHRPYWFYCQAEDDYQPVKYLWRFGEADIVTTGVILLSSQIVFPNGTLLIPNVKEEDVGEYMCVASTGRATIYSRKAQLQLAYIASNFTVNPRNCSVKVNHSVTFQCEIDSFPTPHFRWRLNGLELSVLTLSSGDSPLQSSLTIPSAEYSDAGEYVCVATNSLLAITRYSAPASLTVFGFPEIITGPQSLKLPSSYTAIFNCLSTARPEPLITWFKSTQPNITVQLEPSNMTEILTNGTLVIHKTTTSDSATYTCEATNENGKATMSATLEVTGLSAAPSFLVTPQNQTLNVGDALRLNCSATGNPTPLIQWYKDNSPLTAREGNLHLMNVTVSDAGTYRCMAQNSEGTRTASANINVFHVPELVRRPENLTVSVGTEVRLPCEVTGYPVPVLQWITPTSVVLTTPSTSGHLTVDSAGILIIEDVASDDQGNYTCLAINDFGSLSITVLLTVEGPPVFSVLPASHLALEGENTTFTCRAVGFPIPKVIWIRDEDGQGQQLEADARLLLSPDGDLSILGVRYEDDGTYRCVANNSLGSVQALAVLSVHVIPAFVQAPLSQPVSVGQTIFLHCRVKGVPVPSVRWVRTGSTLMLEENMSLSQNQTLRISSIQPHQLGQYTCVARNQAGQTEASASLYLAGQLYFTTQPGNATVNVSDSLTLSCRANNSKANESSSPIIHWYRALRNENADVLINTIQHVGSSAQVQRYWATAEGNLVFESVADEDEGWYYCTASSEASLIYSDPVFLNIQGPPEIHAISNPPTALDHNQVNLSCSAEGDPDPLITWKSPEGLEVKASDANYGLVGGVLTIRSSTNQKDGGLWTCQACNQLGCDMADIVLGIRGRPGIRQVETQQNVSSLSITCVAVGLPQPEVIYMTQNGTVADLPGHHVTGNQLLIQRQSLQEIYACSARNEFGVYSLNLTKPEEPELKEAVSSARSVTLIVGMFSKLGALPLDGVRVEYRQMTEIRWMEQYIGVEQIEQQLTPVKQTERNQLQETGVVIYGRGANPAESDSVEITVDGFIPYTVYFVRARLVNVLGEGPVSPNSLRVTTLPSAPPSPINVTVTSVDRTVMVTWAYPKHLNGNKDNIYFKAEITNSSGLAISQCQVSTSQEAKVVWSGLNLGYYNVSVKTENSNLQLNSETVTASVLVTEAVPIFVPTIVSVVALSDSAINLTWQIPDEPISLKPPVEGYLLRLQSDSLSSPRLITVNDSNTNSHRITDLKERTEYNCSVAAYNIGGLGSFSRPVTILTQFRPFSSHAFKDLQNQKLALSGKWVAVLGGCIGGVVLILVVIFLVQKRCRRHHVSSLDLLRSSHGLDPVYMENPRGLYRTPNRSMVQWLKGIGVYRLLGTAMSTHINNDHLSSSSNASGSPVGMRETDVAMEPVHGSLEKDCSSDEAGPHRLTWSRFSLARTLRRTLSLMPTLPTRRKAREAKLQISHPHFSGQGATITATFPRAGISSSTCTVAVTLSSTSDAIALSSWSVRSPALTSSSNSVAVVVPSASAAVVTTVSPAYVVPSPHFVFSSPFLHQEEPHQQRLSPFISYLSSRLPLELDLEMEDTFPDGVSLSSSRSSDSLTIVSLQLSETADEEKIGSSTNDSFTEDLDQASNGSMDLTNRNLSHRRLCEVDCISLPSAVQDMQQKDDTMVKEKDCMAVETYQSVPTTRSKLPSQKDFGTLHFENASGFEWVYCTGPKQKQTETSASNTRETDVTTSGESSAHTSPKPSGKLQSKYSHSDKCVMLADGDNVYQILQQLDQDLEDYLPTEAQEQSLDVEALDRSPSSHHLHSRESELCLLDGCSVSVNDCSVGSEHQSESAGNTGRFQLNQPTEERKWKANFSSLQDPHCTSQVGPQSVTESLSSAYNQLTDPSSSASHLYATTRSDSSLTQSRSKFNAELDSYDVNPLGSASFSDFLPRSFACYSEDSTRHSRNFTPDLILERTFKPRFSHYHYPFSQIDSILEHNLLEQLVYTVDTLRSEPHALLRRKAVVPFLTDPSAPKAARSRSQFSAARRKRSLFDSLGSRRSQAAVITSRQIPGLGRHSTGRFPNMLPVPSGVHTDSVAQIKSGLPRGQRHFNPLKKRIKIRRQRPNGLSELAVFPWEIPPRLSPNGTFSFSPGETDWRSQPEITRGLSEETNEDESAEARSGESYMGSGAAEMY